MRHYDIKVAQAYTDMIILHICWLLHVLCLMASNMFHKVTMSLHQLIPGMHNKRLAYWQSGTCVNTVKCFAQCPLINLHKTAHPLQEFYSPFKWYYNKPWFISMLQMILNLMNNNVNKQSLLKE